MADTENPDKEAVRRAFDRAAASYDSAAAVQREICHRLMSFASAHPPRQPVARLVDAGCGTGYGLGLLARQFPAAARIALDFAPAMLSALQAEADGAPPASLVCADVEALPLPDASVDLVWSSLTLQWCDPARALPEIARVLRPGGCAWLATLGPRTLWELRDAFRAVDTAEHVIGFRSLDAWVAVAIQSGFTLRASANSPAFAVGADLRALLRDIKAIGAHTVGAARRREPLGRSGWRTLESRYEAHRRPDGLLPATYDVIYLALERP